MPEAAGFVVTVATPPSKSVKSVVEISPSKLKGRLWDNPA